MCVSSTETAVSPSEALKDILNNKDQPSTEQNLPNNENKEHNDAPMLQEIYFARFFILIYDTQTRRYLIY